MNEINQASFALDIPILLPALGAFTVALASRRWFALKTILCVALSIYMFLTGLRLYGAAINDQSWHRDLIFSLGLVSVALWFVAAGYLLFPLSPHPYRKRILWTLNSYITFLFFTLSGSMTIGYLNVTDLIPDPARLLLFGNSTPDWLRGPDFMWESGAEKMPFKIFFVVFGSLLILLWHWLTTQRKRESNSILATIFVKFLDLRPRHALLCLVPIAAIFVPALQTTWMKILLFALYPVSLVSLGVTRFGYTYFGATEKETGFFGNMENSIPPRA